MAQAAMRLRAESVIIREGQVRTHDTSSTESSANEAAHGHVRADCRRTEPETEPQHVPQPANTCRIPQQGLPFDGVAIHDGSPHLVLLRLRNRQSVPDGVFGCLLVGIVYGFPGLLIDLFVRPRLDEDLCIAGDRAVEVDRGSPCGEAPTEMGRLSKPG